MAEESRSPARRVLSVEGLSKRFCRDLHRSLAYGLKDAISALAGRTGPIGSLRPGEFWALEDLGLELHRGEAVGLIGANGAGKTTLLRIISGLLLPDRGTVAVRGRIAPLLALGAGFSPVLTGRENVRVNLAILGLDEASIDRKFESVVAFAEIGEAIDAPLRTYSSGMAARLGFACGIHAEPDILLIDEVLSVGDARFQAKCQRALGALRDRGCAFILVSHKAQLVLTTCETALYLRRGRVASRGPVREVVAAYEEDLFATGGGQPPGSAPDASEEWRATGFELTDLHVRGPSGDPSKGLVSGMPGALCLGFRAHRRFERLQCTVKVREVGGDGDGLLYLTTGHVSAGLQVEPGNHQLLLRFPATVLGPGLYSAFIRVFEGPLSALRIVESFVFRVESNGTMSQSRLYQPHQWELRALPGPAAGPDGEAPGRPAGSTGPDR